ncbi:MAG: hypothetical protein QXN55_01185 [Candidatus Nitrosotenuis sp.]
MKVKYLLSEGLSSVVNLNIECSLGKNFKLDFKTSEIIEQVFEKQKVQKLNLRNLNGLITTFLNLFFNVEEHIESSDKKQYLTDAQQQVQDEAGIKISFKTPYEFLTFMEMP